MQVFKGKNRLLGLLLLLAVVGSFYLGEIAVFSAAQKILFGVVIFLIALAVVLVPTKKTEQELIEEQDERNQYIELKCAAKAFQAALYVSFLTIVGGMIAFGVTGEYAFIWLAMGGILPYGISRIAYLISAFRYDK